LLGLLALQLAMVASRNSITWDEDDHIFAGYMSWKTGDFGLNPEHPPLVKSLAALPLLQMPLKVPALQGRNFKIEAFLSGKDFLFKNDADRILFRARMAAALLTLSLALLVFLATQEMFGTGAGFLALALLVFDPNLLAHGAVVGTDAGLSCFLFAAIYAFYRYTKVQSAGRLLLVAAATGLTLSAKHTGILVFPMLLLLTLVEIFSAEPHQRWAELRRYAVALVVISAVSLAVLWAFYGFRYAARPAGMTMNPPAAEFFQGLSRPHEVHLLSTVASWKLLPESYLYGLADVRIMSDFYTSFLLGKIYPHGVWFYFPATIAIKSTLPFLLLLLAAAVLIVTGQMKLRRELWFLLLPSALYLFVAMIARMNIGVRHILPMYMFLTVLVAGAAWTLIEKNRRWAYVVALLLFFQVATCLPVFPAYVAYANELWGGPSQAYRLLSDSNADWGQQLKATKRYLDGRGVKDCWFVYFAAGVVDPDYYGIPCKPLPTADSMWVNEEMDVPAAVDGPVLISAGDLSGFEFGPGPLNPYEQFKTLKPAAVIDYGVFVFEGHFEIPLAAALNHAQKAGNLLAAKKPQEALAEAQQAVSLAPDAIRPNAVMGSVLTAMGRPAEARPYLERALETATTVEPEFQRGWAEGLRHQLAALDAKTY
jgi:hypothetical protein